jgi:hypothetical protein
MYIGLTGVPPSKEQSYRPSKVEGIAITLIVKVTDASPGVAALMC